MSKIKYDVLLPKSKAQFEGLLQNIFKSNPKHIVVRVLADYLSLEDLLMVLDKYAHQIENFKKNKSIIIWTSDFDYELIPDFVPVVPTEAEAVDVIDFEEIERDLLLEEE